MMTRSSALVEYIWPCGQHHKDVKIEPAPAIPFAPVEFPLPLAKPVKQFTEFEKGGIPALRKCCKCGDKYHLFRIPEGCKLCGHSFRQPCSTCTIISVTGSREIATVEFRVTGEFDQTPVYWRCRLCEDINPFETAGESHHIITNRFLVAKEGRGLRCRTCSERFYESNWVISPFFVYLGTWDGKVVAESGPWHWSLAWHRDVAEKRPMSQNEEDCCMVKGNGRRKRAIPWIGASGKNMETIEVSPAQNASKSSRRTRAPTLPTPPQSRSPSPTVLTRRRSKSCSSNGSPKSLTVDMYPPPLFSPSAMSHPKRPRTSNPPAPKSPPPPVPSGVDWKTRPLPPVPSTLPKDLKTLQEPGLERGRPKSRLGYHQDNMIRDKAPNRTHRAEHLQPTGIRNSHQTHRRTRSGEISFSGGTYTTPLDANPRQIHHSKSQTFQRTSPTQRYVIPEQSSSFLLFPTPEPSPVPKIAIQPESPVRELQRSDSIITSSSCYSNDDIGIGPLDYENEDEINSHSFILPMSPEEAVVMIAALEESRHKDTQHTREDSSGSVSSSTIPTTSTNPRDRSNSGNNTQPPRTPTTPKAPTQNSRPPSRSSPPRYLLFPQITNTPPPMTTTAKVLRPSSSSTALRTPPRTLRASSSSVALRPPPQNGYGHLRSRSDGLRPGIRSMVLGGSNAGPSTSTATTTGTTIGFDSMGRQVLEPAPVLVEKSSSRRVSPILQHATGQKLEVPVPKTDTPILDQNRGPGLGFEQQTMSEERKSRRPARDPDWQGFVDDDDSDHIDHAEDGAGQGYEYGYERHGRGSWSRSRSHSGHSRRQTLVNAFKPKNWF